MRVYHFVNAEYGLSNISCRRLKVSDLNDLNDPFELLPACSEDSAFAFSETKKTLGKANGILCFSRNWENPVQWAHYADRHKGICLGFDVTDLALAPVNYSNCRPWFIHHEFSLKNGVEQEKWMQMLLHTKYLHWQYEDEFRQWVQLTQCVRETRAGGVLYFKEFDSDLVLREVAIGSRSILTQVDIRNALGQGASGIDVFKVSPSPTEFKMLKIPT